MSLKSLFDRAVTKGLKVMAKYVPYNTKYKPKGAVSLDSLVKKQNVVYTEINTPYFSQLTLDPKFVEDCSSYNKPTLSVQYPGDYLVTIKNGRVYNIDRGNIAVISGDNYLIEDLSFQWRSGEKLAPGSDNIIFTKKMFSSPQRYSGTVFSLLSGGGAVDYYYHWVIDSIPKLFLLQKSALIDQVDYFLVPNYALKFQIEYLKIFGIPEHKIINAETIRHIQAESLIVASYIRIMAHLPKWVPDFLFKSIVPPSPAKKNKLIYIARGDAAVNRKVLNEAELIVMLQKMNFEIHFLSKLSVTEQAELFSSAKLIVASHGGGLTNLVFCNPGAKVVEFFPDNYVNHLFYDICNKRKVDYEYVVCRAADFTGNDLDRALANVVADLDLIRKKVIKLLIAE
jgi:hypothetical protein